MKLYYHSALTKSPILVISVLECTAWLQAQTLLQAQEGLLVEGISIFSLQKSKRSPQHGKAMHAMATITFQIPMQCHHVGNTRQAKTSKSVHSHGLNLFPEVFTSVFWLQFQCIQINTKVSVFVNMINPQKFSSFVPGYTLFC